MCFMHNFKNHFYSAYYIDKYLGYMLVLIHIHLIIEVFQFKQIENVLNWIQSRFVSEISVRLVFSLFLVHISVPNTTWLDTYAIIQQYIYKSRLYYNLFYNLLANVNVRLK